MADRLLPRVLDVEMWERLPVAVRKLLPLTVGCLALIGVIVWLQSASSAADQSPPVTSALAQFYEQCAPDRPSYQECNGLARELQPRYGELFRALPVFSGSARSTWTPFTLNTHGLGIECLHFATTAYAKNAAFVVASPKGRRVQWSPPPGYDWGRYPRVEPELETAPWPNTHSASVVHMVGLEAGEHVLCVHLPMEPKQPVIVYAAAALYDELPTSREDGVAVQVGYDAADLLALGLRPNNIAQHAMRTALEAGDVAGVKRMLARGVPIASSLTPAPLITALRGRWPLEELETLLRAGAKPNEVADGTTVLCALARRREDQTDEAVGAAAKLLIDAGADVSAPDSKGTVPMLCAMKSNASALIYELASRLQRGTTFVAPP